MSGFETPPRGQGSATSRGTHAFSAERESPRKSPARDTVLPVAVRGGDQLNVEKALRELLPFAENPVTVRALILKVIHAINAKEPLDVLLKDGVQMCLVDASTKPEAAYVTVYLARLLHILQPIGFNEAVENKTLARLLQRMRDILTPLGPETTLFDPNNPTHGGVLELRFGRHTRFYAAAREAAQAAARAGTRAGTRTGDQEGGRDEGGGDEPQGGDELDPPQNLRKRRRGGEPRPFGRLRM